MKSVFVIIGIGLILIGCQPETPQPTTNDGTMTCTLNGESWSATTYKNTLELNITDGVDSAKLLELMGKNSSGQQLTLRVGTSYDTEVENIPLGTYLSTSSSEAAGVQYFSNGLGSGESTGGINTSNPGYAEISITNFNQSNHTCSGTFSFILQDYMSGDTLYTGTNGQFVSLVYTLL